MGEAPPLEGSSWVAGAGKPRDQNCLARPPRTHRSAQQDLQSGDAGIRANFDDADIAALLTYVRKRFGGGEDPDVGGGHQRHSGS